MSCGEMMTNSRVNPQWMAQIKYLQNTYSDVNGLAAAIGGVRVERPAGHT